MIARAVVVVLALAAATVLAADLRTTMRIEDAVAGAERSPTPTAVRHATAELSEIAAGTSDTAPLLRAAQLRLAVSDYRGALEPALMAARREPENAQAWLIAVLAADGAHDRAAAAQARARIAALVARPG